MQLRTHSSRVGAFVTPLLFVTMASGLAAQRFEQWTAQGTLVTPPGGHIVTDPATGAPVVVTTPNGSSASDTLSWDGAAFVSLGISGNPGLGAGENMAALSSGLVYLDSNGVTHFRANGGNWTSLGVLTPSPSPRAFAAMTNASFGTNAFLFGGGTGTATFNDFWSFNGSSWTLITPTSGPTPGVRIGASLVHDGVGGLLLFGGSGTGGILGDLWRFDGSAWTQIVKSSVKRMFHSMIYDVSRNSFVIVGGQDASGTTQAAVEMTLAGSSPIVATFTTISTTLPVTSSWLGFSYGCLDAVRHELMVLDALTGDMVRDEVASGQQIGISPTTNCIVPNLQLLPAGSSAVQPRINSTFTVGGLGNGAPPGTSISLFGEFVTVAGGFSPLPTPIAGTSCLSFLSGSAGNMQTTAIQLTGAYQFAIPVPNSTSLVGAVLHLQAFGATGAQVIASEAQRVVIGR